MWRHRKPYSEVQVILDIPSDRDGEEIDVGHGVEDTDTLLS
jgi:hypothetical protein